MKSGGQGWPMGEGGGRGHEHSCHDNTFVAQRVMGGGGALEQDITIS